MNIDFFRRIALNKLIELLEKEQIDFCKNEPMSKHTTFKIGGAAQLYIKVKSNLQLKTVLDCLKEEKIPFFVVGNGSNLLVSDSGVKGAVIELCGEFSQIALEDSETIVVGAGAKLISLCKFAFENELTGLEFAYGIPGTVGGAVFMNAGAYGGQMSDVVECVNHVDDRLNFGSFGQSELAFGYRKSAYSDGGYVITSARLKLKKGNKKLISEKMNELLSKRKEKQPLEFPSAGSTFKRPEGYFAGALIEQSGLKGKTIGGARVSPKHAGFIVNIGGATCKDVCDLVEFCQKTVNEKFGVKLETEIKKI